MSFCTTRHLRVALSLALFSLVCFTGRPWHAPAVHADSNYYALSSGTFTQDWSNGGQITVDDDWSGVPHIVGYRGDDLTGGTGVNPGTLTGTSPIVDVMANLSNPNSASTGGVAEFALDNPVVALQGSGTADAPYLQLNLNAEGRQNIRVQYNARDVDGSADDAVQPLALQYRRMETGDWINVAAAYIPDATTVGEATLVTARDVVLPPSANGTATLQVRFITSNAVGNDEWVGLDDITVSSEPCQGPCPGGVDPTPVLTLIHDIQGPGRLSPRVGETVTTQGIVTARARNGFFLQSPASESDSNPLTSQGLFVFTSSTPSVVAGLGDKVQVTGRVAEFGQFGEETPTVTELTTITNIQSLTDGSVADVPPVVALGITELSPTTPFDYLERYEGMRISVPATVVMKPNGSRSFTSGGQTQFVGDGTFYVTLPGLPKAYREPGIEAHAHLALGEPTGTPLAPASVPRFDTNPEVLRIDTDEMFDYADVRTPPLNVTINATISGFTGVLHFEERTYTALPTEVITAANNALVAVQPVPATTANEAVIASANLEFFSLTGADYATRSLKVVRAVCDVLRAPDILGVIEVGNLATLEDLAGKLTAYPGCGGAAYQALLRDPDNGTQNTGFLVKTRVGAPARVTVVSDTRISDTIAGVPPTVNDRRPYVLQATVRNSAGITLPVTVIVNHLRSLIDVDSPTSDAARIKRRDQAIYLAGLVQQRQTENPNINLALVGDFNAFEFNDGYTDPTNTILGTPTPDAQTYVAGDGADLVSPNLVNLLFQLPPAERWSYNNLGDRQVLDQFVANTNLVQRLVRFTFSHPNAEYPEIAPNGTVLRRDASRPERFSDHDVPIAVFRIAEPVNVSSAVRVVSFGLLLDRAMQAELGLLTLTNRSTAALTGPFTVVLNGLPAGVTLVNAAGSVNGSPYMVSDTALLPPGASVCFLVHFRSPGTSRASYAPAVFVGTF